MATTEQNQRGSTTLPNLYELLQLDSLENDRGKIEAALRRAIAQAKSVGVQDPKRAQRLAKIVDLGKRNLLDAELKVAYDQRWKAAYEPVAIGAEGTSTLEWDYSLLDTLLPSGDPDNAFDLGGFLEHAATQPEVHVEADYHKLQSLLTGNAMPAASASVTPVSTSVPVTSAMANASSPLAPPPMKQANSMLNATAGSPVKSKNLAKQLRKKREQSLLIMIGGVLLSLGILLGLLYVMVLRPGQLEDDTNNAVAMQEQPGNPAAEANTPPPTPRGSGLPKVSGLDEIAGANGMGGMGLPSDSTIGQPSEPDLPTEPMPPVVTPTDNASMDDAPMINAGMEIPMEAASENTASVDSTPMNTIATPEPELSDADKAGWQKVMTDIRTAIGQQDFAQADEKLAVAESLLKTSAQKSQMHRLQVMKGKTQEFCEALVSAIAGLGPGETFNVKSTPVSFVEGSAERIVIRRDGSNQAYQLTEIPVGLAYALVDLKLDVAHPSTLARKAGFAIFHPKTNSLVLNQAKSMMAEAIEAGFLESEMVELFDDVYLP